MNSAIQDAAQMAYALGKVFVNGIRVFMTNASRIKNVRQNFAKLKQMSSVSAWLEKTKAPPTLSYLFCSHL